MKRGALGLGGWGLVALTPAGIEACGSERSCEETLTCAREAGGSTGSGGTATEGGEGGAPPSAGGSSAGGSSAGGSSAGGSSGRSGGKAGTSAVGGASGSGARAGAGGMAGEGGGGESPVDCSEDAECEDGLECNGTSTCVDGACRPGTPFCAEDAEAGCTVTCSEGTGGPVCDKVSEDLDGDDHAAVGNTCSAADKAADDCDDADERAYPGAPETCDGVDSDCDGLEDIDDGETLSGPTVRIGDMPNSTPDAAGAWSEALGSYGIYAFSRDSGGNDRRGYFALEQDGTKSPNVPGSTAGSSNSSLVAGHGGFGHLHVESGVPGISFERIDSAGVASSPVAVKMGSVTESALALTAQGWVAAWIQTGALLAHRLDPDGVVQTGVAVDLAPDSEGEAKVSAATDGQNVVFAYDADDGIWLRRFSQGLVAIDDPAIQVDTAGDDPAVGVGPGGYGVAWLGAWPDVLFAEVNRAGEVVCGPVKVGENSVPQDASIAVQARGSGFLVAHAENANYRVLVRRVGPDCTPISPELVVDDATGAYKGQVGLHAGSAGFLVTWREPNALQSFYRLFGPNFCD